MAHRKSLNVSGFSPIQLNTSNLTSFKSPGKDFGINERIEAGRDKIISEFERWKTAENNGFHILNIIHNLKEKVRLSGQSNYPQELENYCNKLNVIRRTFEDVIKGIQVFRKEISGSVDVLKSFKDNNEELRQKLELITKYLDILLHQLTQNLKRKCHVIEQIAHTMSSNESNILITLWNNDESQNEIFKLVLQLKISPTNHRWNV